MKLATLGATALLGLVPLISGCGNFSPGRAALTATGYVSHQLCTAVFLSGQDAARHYRDAIEPVAGPSLLAVLSKLKPLDEEFPPIARRGAEPVDL